MSAEHLTWTPEFGAHISTSPCVQGLEGFIEMREFQLLIHIPPPKKKTKEISHKSDLITITKDLSITVLSIYPSKNIFQGFQIILNRPFKKAHPFPLCFFSITIALRLKL